MAETVPGILSKIAAAARLRVAEARDAKPLGELRRQAEALGSSGGKSFAAALSSPGVSFICEVKRASPSRGVIAADFPYLRIAGDYEAAGAAAISVLTEPEFFLGSDAYLREIAAQVSLPVLRKDFVIDPYQIYEAKVLGARAVLLIAALLDTPALKDHIALAAALGLDALVEVHDGLQTQAALEAGARIIGINNRDLRTFRVDTGTTAALRPLIPPGILTVSESGIAARRDIALLETLGVDGALIGETLMRAQDKKAALAELRGGA
ncbi:MAG: indole-3-glycerol phosphate synthase TrpC [Spirochaetaceae bacterium]|jgi:indole-3-glycerol phosphate synthase|nr:indole-3-glycerol phosphate synthase TrpC [Spirochaetaceae bacterium]